MVSYYLDEILGNEMGVNSLRLKDCQTNEIKVIEITGVFIAIGHKPNTSIFENKLEMEMGILKSMAVLMVMLQKHQ